MPDTTPPLATAAPELGAPLQPEPEPEPRHLEAYYAAYAPLVTPPAFQAGARFYTH